MRAMPRLLTLLAVAVVIPATATSARAQGEPSDCAGALAKLRTQPNNIAGIRTASRCPESGPVTLAALWTRRDAVGVATRAALVEESGSLRDTRLMDAVVGVATGGDRPVADRLAALQVLMRYYDRRYVLSVDDLSTESIGSPIPRSVGGPPPVYGSSPLAQTTRGTIGTMLSTLASSDADHAVRHAALRLRQGLAFADPANTPLPEGSITLVAGCGSRVMLRSTADVDLELQLRVLGTSYARAKSISAGSVAKPRQLLLGLPAGTVVATYGGREVARLTERNASCPVGMPR
jgi:hypothetical protein